ncbi:unnamed protein product [Prorocentrum cordatum]|uniref:Spondin-like TSP1 domain-containing protein n=1 Tax=Prorocentrum cordatum TaxID=2364126 RepID=A0ABN9PGI1_9DINO|nr:unnamed protein product [Polarella glacialis]
MMTIRVMSWTTTFHCLKSRISMTSMTPHHSPIRACWMPSLAEVGGGREGGEGGGLPEEHQDRAAPRDRAAARGTEAARGRAAPRERAAPRGPAALRATAQGDRGDKGDTPKPIDCVWADWAAYSSDCTQTCGTKANPGSQVRSRSYKVDPQNGGKSCEGPMFERAKCSKVKACPTTTTTTTTTGAAKSSTMSIRASCRTSLALLACASMSFLP